MPLDIEQVKRQIITILRHHQIKRASLFGSLAKGELRDDSDIDILIEFEGRKSLFDLVDVKQDLEETLQRKVDVLTYNSLHPLMKEEIFESQVEIL